MIKIKRIAFLFIIIILASAAGCSQNESAKQVKAAALEIQARFDEVLDDYSYTSAAGGTINFEDIAADKVSSNTSSENLTEPENTEISENNINITETSINKNIEETSGEKLFVVTPTGKKYHLPTCRTVKNIKEYLTREEAEAKGYEPCKICNP